MSAHVQRVRALYKTILHLHRGLPIEMRVVGDNYVRNEFKRHKQCTADEAVVFMHQWTDYALTISEQLLSLRVNNNNNNRTFGKQLSSRELDLFTDEQLVQLHELMKAAKNDLPTKH